MIIRLNAKNRAALIQFGQKISCKHSKGARCISYLDLCWMFPMLFALNLLLSLLKDRLKDEEVDDEGDTEVRDSGGDSDSELWRKTEECIHSL